jgi:hyperosmotically inducible protein
MTTVSKNSLAAAVLIALMAAPAASQASSTEQYIDDATLTTKVKAALLTDSQLKATQVNVKTTQGVVQLMGSVDTKTQEAEALRVANQVDGVKSVQDILSVKSTQEQ